jgi:hypothetical protein
VTTKDPDIVAARAAYAAYQPLSTILEWISGPDWTPYTAKEWAGIWRYKPRGHVVQRSTSRWLAAPRSELTAITGEIFNAF